MCWKGKEEKLPQHLEAYLHSFITCESKRAFWSLWKSQRLANQENWFQESRTARTNSFTLPHTPSIRVKSHVLPCKKHLVQLYTVWIGGQYFEVLIKFRTKYTIHHSLPGLENVSIRYWENAPRGLGHLHILRWLMTLYMKTGVRYASPDTNHSSHQSPRLAPQLHTNKPW